MEIQLWLDTYYPKSERGQIKHLYINSKPYEGHLDLTDFINLEKLECRNTRISSVDLSKCEELSKLVIIQKNQKNVTEIKNNLNTIDLSNNSKLTYIEFNTGGKLTADLKIFSHLTDLEHLDLSGGIISTTSASLGANDFHGSLQAFENCSKLKYLNVNYNININEGLEYLPIHLYKIDRFRGTVVERTLESFDYDINIWRMFKKGVFNSSTTENGSVAAVAELDSKSPHKEKPARTKIET